MRTIMAKTPHDSALSFSKRHLQWATKKPATGSNAGPPQARRDSEEDGDELEDAPALASSAVAGGGEEGRSAPKKRAPRAAVSRFRAAFAAAIAVGRLRRSGAGAGAGAGGGLGSRVTGTLFGRRRGHVHFAFQADPRACPVLLIELATPTSGLVREMASGLVRIALECDKRPHGADGAGAAAGGKRRLLEEPMWRTFCNGKKCGYAVRRECGPADWRVLRAVEPVSMGAGVLPGAAAATAAGEGEEEGEMMYMRARFERVVGSRDSEAFYMMSPDSNGGPELSIYLLRV
ncbi:hypothetical protein Taro_015302 [Colocasia esculenta]|uniref:Protein MIZU-KUSSEI 1 n=1 Tax=Colocasia esculenta TaxID=4460 RepID=A0A843ULT4_COLES|nr:hypothetical protein [Colocasia esculenta]